MLMNTLPPLRLWPAAAALVFSPLIAESQELNVWDRIIGAMESGIDNAKIRGILKGCETADPTPSQYGTLSDLLSGQGLQSPSDQGRWIRQFRCPLPEAAPPAPVKVSSRVTVRSDRAGELVVVNGNRAGTTPIALELDSGTYMFSIGEREYRRDTLLNIGVDRPTVIDVSTTERSAGPVPIRADVERELSALFLPIPDAPSSPVAPTRPSGGGSFGFGLLLGGAAAAAAFPTCTTMATAPSPYGGFFAGAYYGPGATVPTLKTACAGAVGGGAMLFSFAVIHGIRKSLFRAKERQYAVLQSDYAQQRAKIAQAIGRNRTIVDSAMTYRLDLAARKVITRSLSVQISDPK